MLCAPTGSAFYCLNGKSAVEQFIIKYKQETSQSLTSKGKGVSLIIPLFCDHARTTIQGFGRVGI